MGEGERGGELEKVTNPLGLDANILELYNGSLAPFEPQIVEIKLVRVEKVKSSEEVSQEALLEVGGEEVRHVDEGKSLPGSLIR
jgi:hypothetical protein